MAQMHERQDKINRPLPNHNYLREVAWTLADQADAQGEKSRNELERNGSLRSHCDPQMRPPAPSKLDQYYDEHGRYIGPEKG